MRRWIVLAFVVWLPSTALGQPAEPPADAPTGEPAAEPAPEPSPVAPPVEPAPAAPPLAAAPAEEEPSNLDDFSHRYQVNVRATFGKGYRMAFAYGDHEVCGTEDGTPDETPCYSASPAFTDLDLGFGLTDGLEASVSVRLGLEDEYDSAFPLTLGLGIRSYADPPSRVKVFLGGRLLWDLTETGIESKQDFAARAEFGLQVEIVRYVALYVQTGVTVGFLRWLRFEADAGGGVQFRVP